MNSDPQWSQGAGWWKHEKHLTLQRAWCMQLQTRTHFLQGGSIRIHTQYYPLISKHALRHIQRLCLNIHKLYLTYTKITCYPWQVNYYNRNHKDWPSNKIPDFLDSLFFKGLQIQKQFFPTFLIPPHYMLTISYRFYSFQGYQTFCHYDTKLSSLI